MPAHLLTHLATSVLLADLPNPDPADPTAGSNALKLLLSYAKWGALAACAISAVVSGGILAAGSLSNRPDHADKGKRALIWSIGGVIVAAAAIPLVNTVFGAAS